MLTLPQGFVVSLFPAFSGVNRFPGQQLVCGLENEVRLCNFNHDGYVLGEYGRQGHGSGSSPVVSCTGRPLRMQAVPTQEMECKLCGMIYHCWM